MIADFTITINHARRPRAVRVVIHDNLAALRSAATKHTNSWLGSKKKKLGDFSETLGICHRFHIQDDPLCAIVRLAPPNLGIGILSHELAHAAVWIWVLEDPKGENALLTCENDEQFCWILGELVRCAVVNLIEKGVYEEA